MYSSTWARWIPTSGSSPLAWQQENHLLSWNYYRVWVRPEYLAR